MLLQALQPVLLGRRLPDLDRSVRLLVDDDRETQARGVVLGERKGAVELGVVARREPDVEAGLDRLPQVAGDHGNARDVELAIGLFVIVVVEEADEPDRKRNDQRNGNAEAYPKRDDFLKELSTLGYDVRSRVRAESDGHW